MEQNNSQNPYEMELLDLWNEVGGQLVIKYHRATVTPTKEDLQMLRDKGFGTDVMTCIMSSLVGNMSQEEALAFMQEAQDAGAAPSVTLEAPEGEALNIKSNEENPLFDVLVQAVENQGKEVEP